MGGEALPRHTKVLRLAQGRGFRGCWGWWLGNRRMTAGALGLAWRDGTAVDTIRVHRRILGLPVRQVVNSSPDAQLPVFIGKMSSFPPD
jgi:hypothetical protein